MQTIDASKIKSVYAGKSGCACGCRGNHTKDPGQITRVVNRLNALPPAQRKDDKDGTYYSGEYTTPGGEERLLIAYVE